MRARRRSLGRRRRLPRWRRRTPACSTRRARGSLIAHAFLHPPAFARGRGRGRVVWGGGCPAEPTLVCVCRSMTSRASSGGRGSGRRRSGRAVRRAARDGASEGAGAPDRPRPRRRRGPRGAHGRRRAGRERTGGLDEGGGVGRVPQERVMARRVCTGRPSPWRPSGGAPGLAAARGAEVCAGLCPWSMCAFACDTGCCIHSHRATRTTARRQRTRRFVARVAWGWGVCRV